MNKFNVGDLVELSTLADHSLYIGSGIIPRVMYPVIDINPTSHIGEVIALNYPNTFYMAKDFELVKSINYNTGRLSLVNLNPQTLPKKQSCNHKWEHYIGVMRKFDYCTICDEKRDIKSVFEGV